MAWLTQFEVNILTVAPGRASSPRHWHRTEDEGDATMRPGDLAAARFLVVGGKSMNGMVTCGALDLGIRVETGTPSLSCKVIGSPYRRGHGASRGLSGLRNVFVGVSGAKPPLVPEFVADAVDDIRNCDDAHGRQTWRPRLR